MKCFLYMLLALVIFGCSANIQSASENKKTKLGNDCFIKVQKDMKCSLNMNDDVVSFYMKIKGVYSSSWAIDSIYVKLKNTEKGFFIKGSDDVTMQFGDIMAVESYDINFDGIADVAISTSFGLANRYRDYWLVDKEGRFKFIGNYPYFRVDFNQKTLETQVRSSAAEYIQDTYHWEGTTLVSDKTVIIGPDNISELWYP